MRPTPAPAQQPVRGIQQEQRAPVPEIIPEGDFAGHKTSDVLVGLYGQLTETLGDMNLEEVKGITDMHLSELMMAVDLAQGPHEAKLTAVRYGETLVPYMIAETDEQNDALLYGSLRRQITHEAHKDDPEDAD